MAFTIPGIIIVVVAVWYSVGVWRSTDRYFKEEYKRHLQKEYKEDEHSHVNVKHEHNLAKDNKPEITEQPINSINKPQNDNDKWEEDNIQPTFLDEQKCSSGCQEAKYNTIGTQSTETNKKEEWLEDNTPCLAENSVSIDENFNNNYKKYKTKTHQDRDDDSCPLYNSNEDCGK